VEAAQSRGASGDRIREGRGEGSAETRGLGIIQQEPQRLTPLVFLYLRGGAPDYEGSTLLVLDDLAEYFQLIPDPGRDRVGRLIHRYSRGEVDAGLLELCPTPAEICLVRDPGLLLGAL
jgi:hypothetical protein